MKIAMKTMSLALAAAMTLGAFSTATADGTPRRVRSAHHVPAYVRAGLSYNLITPYYVGYFPTHYSHYRPDPVPYGYTYHPRLYRDGCWVAFEGEIWRDC